MNEKNDFELNLAKLFVYLWRRLPFIILIALLVSAASFFYFRTPVVTTYNGKAAFFARPNFEIAEAERVNNESVLSETTEKNTAFGSIETLCCLSSSPSVLEAVIEKSDLSYSSDELSSRIIVRSEYPGAYAFVVNVQSDNEAEALQIAQKFAEYLPSIIADLNPTSVIHVINGGTVSVQTSGGSDTKKPVMNAIISAAAMLVLFAVIFVIKEYSGNNRVFTNEINRLYPKAKILSSYLSTHDTSAAKRLRTNVLLSLPEKEGCVTLGFTAAHPDPEKAEIAFNLAKALSELGDRVLLVDADLRNHTLSRITKNDAAAGLSDLIRQNMYDSSFIQTIEDGSSLSILPAGIGSEDASELLNSRKLIPLLDKIKADYDFVLFDLEPIGENIDAASVGKNLDGMLVAFRSEGFTRNQLAQCMSQLEYAAVNVLGFVELKKKKPKKRA